MAGFLLAVALAAVQAGAAHSPPDAQGLPPRAGDHVVVMDVEESQCPACGPQRRTVMRSAGWVRDEDVYRDRTETSFSDFASGASFRIVRDPAGAIRSLKVERLTDGDYRILSRIATGRRDRVLGESCEIWVVSGRFHQSESCETADGIQLWTRYPSAAGGRDIRSERAVSVERRPLRPQEVRPPADVFAQAPWPARTAIAPAPAYSVRLVSTSRGAPREQILRRQGNLGSAERESEEGMRHFWGGDGESYFSYQAGADGRPLRLEVGLHDRRYQWRLPERWEPVAGRRPRTVLRERCIWQDQTAIRSTDVHYECRTRDGVPLMLEDDWHWDSVTDIYTARSLSRRALAGDAFAPPAAAVDWAAWGVAPAPAE